MEDEDTFRAEQPGSLTPSNSILTDSSILSVSQEFNSSQEDIEVNVTGSQRYSNKRKTEKTLKREIKTAQQCPRSTSDIQAGANSPFAQHFVSRLQLHLAQQQQQQRQQFNLFQMQQLQQQIFEQNQHMQLAPRMQLTPRGSIGHQEGMRPFSFRSPGMSFSLSQGVNGVLTTGTASIDVNSPSSTQLAVMPTNQQKGDNQLLNQRIKGGTKDKTGGDDIKEHKTGPAVTFFQRKITGMQHSVESKDQYLMPLDLCIRTQ